jgi:hypothetical protein
MIAERVRCSGAAMTQARLEGLNAEQADRWAVRLGVHPSAIWPEWWDVPEVAEQLDLWEVSA